MEQWEQLRNIGKKKGLTFASMVRLAIDFYLRGELLNENRI